MDDHAYAAAFGAETSGDLAVGAGREPLTQGVAAPATTRARWRADLPAILSTGLICGVLTAMFAISAAALLFSTVLSTHITLAIGICLFGTIVLNVAIALFSSCPGMISVTQEVTVVTLAVIAASIHGKMFATHSEAEILATIIVMIGLATTLTGAALFAMGVFRLGALIRFIPYPALAGFLAGIGWLIVSGAMAAILGAPLSAQSLPALLETANLVKWIPAVAFAFIVDLAARRSGSPMVLPLAIAAFLLVFHVAIWMLDLPLADLQAQGWLFAPAQEGSITLPFQSNPLAQADWTVIWSELPKISGLLAISGASLLIASSGIELSVRRDIDLDRELRAAGLANLLAGAGGGAAGFQGLGLTILAHHLGAPYRSTGLLVAAVCVAVLFYGATLLSFIPIPLFGGLLLWIGGGLLYQWLIGVYAKVSRREYLVVVLIVLLIINVGLLEGVTVGVFAAAALFMLEYSLIDIVKYADTGETYQSRAEHGPDNVTYLKKNGAKIQVLGLQGFVFFGSVHQLHQRVRQCFETPNMQGTRFLILDCRDVTGFDTSAIQSLSKICEMVREQEGRLVVGALKPALSQRLNRLLNPKGLRGSPVLHFDEIDTAFAWCEHLLLHELEHRSSTQSPEQVAQNLTRDAGCPYRF